jgi:hypothetical protein
MGTQNFFIGPDWTSLIIYDTNVAVVKQAAWTVKTTSESVAGSRDHALPEKGYRGLAAIASGGSRAGFL